MVNSAISRKKGHCFIETAVEIVTALKQFLTSEILLTF